jgi:hypothetical protein
MEYQPFMTSQVAMSAMSVIEFSLWALIGFLFLRRKLYRRFPFMGAYLGLRVASMPMLVAAYYLQAQPWGRASYHAYFYAFWAVYIASAVLLLLVSIEVFQSALSALPGLMKIGIVIFRWAIIVSLVLTFSSISFVHHGIAAVPDIAVGLMRSVSVLDLCLLAFLCLSMNALHLSIRDMSFGIALGFGVMAANDFAFAALAPRTQSLTATLQFGYEAMTLVSLVVWIAYCSFPEAVRKPLTMPANSTIYRWNEIASALGHTGTQIAVQQPANSFFLTDVEKVVEKVLTRNLKGRESES